MIRNSDLSSSDDAPIFTNIQLKTPWADDPTQGPDGFLGPFNADTVDACPPVHFNPLYISHELTSKPCKGKNSDANNCCIYPSDSGLTTGDCDYELLQDYNWPLVYFMVGYTCGSRRYPAGNPQNEMGQLHLGIRSAYQGP